MDIGEREEYLPVQRMYFNKILRENFQNLEKEMFIQI